MITDLGDLEDLDGLAGYLRSHHSLRAKGEIRLVSEVIGGGSWVHGPGDDAAVVPLPGGANSDGQGHVLACGEALQPTFVARDPYGAGLAAVLANVNDLAAMGATPLGIVDTVVGSVDVARQSLLGMQAGSEMYDVPLIGGHLSIHDGAPAVSAFGIGHAESVLSVTNVAVGQPLIVAGCTQGEMRTDFPFFRSFSGRGRQMAGDVRLLPEIAASGACVAAKDVSMAGLVGSLAMLLEWSRSGVTLDLDAVPCPEGVDVPTWLTCFPACLFLLCATPGREGEVMSVFHARGLDAAVVGRLDNSGLLRISAGAEVATVLDTSLTPVTGLRR